MARRFGSDSSPFQNQSISLNDPNGIPLIETNNTFGSSPMGVALREQSQFGLPNASFNLLPPDPSVALDDNENPLPFWSVQTTNNITATTVYDSTSQTWGVKIDPGTAPSGDYITLKTRSWVTTDDNLAIRQKASLTMAKVGTYSGSTQWNLTLSSVYYDHTNTAISTAIIGTVYDNTTWTSISGTTTTGGSAIPASASWVEFTIKLTATATVSSSTGVTLQSLLVATSTPATGSFVVTETFASSGTWTRPTGVTTLLAVIGIGGGAGGAGGEVASSNKTSLGLAGVGLGAGGAKGGSSSSWALIQNLYVGDQTTISVGVGTAGAGGAGTTFTKAATGTARMAAGDTGSGSGSTAGGAGGATTFGTYLTVPGGRSGGTAGASATTTMYGAVTFAAVNSVITGSGNALCAVGTASTTSAYSQIPYQPSTYSAGSAGGASSGSGGGTVMSGTAGIAGSAGLTASGGGGGRVAFAISTYALTGTNAGDGGAGGAGGGGAPSARSNVGSTTIAGTAGNGGAAAANSGAGGGGGGSMACLIDTLANYTASTISVTSGSGGAGGAGICYVFYVA